MNYTLQALATVADGPRVWYVCQRGRALRSTQHIDERLARLWLRNMLLFGRPGLPEDWYRAASRLVLSSSKNAAVRGREHALRVYDVLALFRDQDYRCAVSSVPLEPLARARGEAHPWGPSLDQITPGAGYVPGNVRIVCLAANVAMGRWGETVLNRLALEVCRFRDMDPLQRNADSCATLANAD